VSDGDCTRCGHSHYDHQRPTKQRRTACTVRGPDVNVERIDKRSGRTWTSREPTWCPCIGYTVAVLPKGERLEFGRHRLPQDEAETAEAWPPL
jgi:hypothetical protein